MPQSFTSIERDNPPPRRKSCLACTKARRRCDQGSPTCQRCSQRGIVCQYPQGSRSNRAAALACLPNPLPVSPSAYVSGAEQRIDYFFDLSPNPHPSLDTLDAILETPDNFLESLTPTFLDSVPPLLETSQALIYQGPPATGTQRALERSQHAANSRVTKALTARLQYGVDKITAAPRQMVLENQMPWCHAHLYNDGMPRSMQDAVSSAALHAAKNDVNTRVIRDCIESRVQDLLSSPAPTAPLDALARAQALFIYQTLRMDDTDARVRLSYDATMPHLEEAAHALLPHITFHDPVTPGHTPDVLPLYPISAARDFWVSWVFQESARRTLAMILFYVVAYQYVRGEYQTKCGTNRFVSRSVTLSAHLWQAGDPVDFAIAWRNKRHYIVHSEAMDTVPAMMDDAKNDDIDDFGKMCLASVLGRDEAKGWLALRGARL